MSLQSKQNKNFAVVLFPEGGSNFHFSCFNEHQFVRETNYEFFNLNIDVSESTFEIARRKIKNCGLLNSEMKQKKIQLNIVEN